MISRYSRKELVKIWSEENKYNIWLDIEIAAAEAMEKYKMRIEPDMHERLFTPFR